MQPAAQVGRLTLLRSRRYANNDHHVNGLRSGWSCAGDWQAALPHRHRALQNTQIRAYATDHQSALV